MRKTIQFCIFAALAICLIIGTSANRSSYGEACSKTRRCERRAWLNCFNGTCDCIKQDEMLYEPETEKCASKAGERCKYALEDPDGSTVFEYTSCISNANCSQDGYCSCTEEFYENTNGTCSAKGKHSETCDDNAPCSASLGFSCVGGSCQCKQHSEYSEELEQCVGLAGRACVTKKCTNNATCNGNETCACDSKSYGDSVDKCVPKRDYNGNCTADNQCIQEKNKDLKCVRGKCTCNPANSFFGTAKRHYMRCYSNRDFYQFESLTSTQCLGKEGNRCINGYCSLGAYCRYTVDCEFQNYGYAGICKCLPGHNGSPRGTCGKPYGTTCDSSTPCMDGLVCSGTCRCRYNSQTYDSTTKMCKSPVGGPCNELTGCTDGAECLSFNSNFEGTCQCKGSYIEVMDRKCELRFGSACNSSTACDVVGGLRCIEGSCQCKDFRRYNEEQHQCMGLVGGRCNVKINDKKQCIENTRCVRSRGEDDMGRCTCAEGFAINGNYTCDKVATSIPGTNTTVAAPAESANVIEDL